MRTWALILRSHRKGTWVPNHRCLGHGDKWIPVAHWPARLAKFVSSRFKKRPHLKTKQECDWRKQSRLTSHLHKWSHSWPSNTWAYLYEQINLHPPPHTEKDNTVTTGHFKKPVSPTLFIYLLYHLYLTELLKSYHKIKSIYKIILNGWNDRICLLGLFRSKFPDSIKWWLLNKSSANFVQRSQNIIICCSEFTKVFLGPLWEARRMRASKGVGKERNKAGWNQALNDFSSDDIVH